MLNKALLPGLAGLALTCLSFLPTAARAQDPAAPKAPWLVACDGDIKKLCQTEIKANGDVRPCLAGHEGDLTQVCKDTFLRKYRIAELCKDDIEKVCAGAQGKALGECFNDGEKQKQMSEQCKSALRQGSKEHKQETAATTPPAAAKPAAATASAAVKPGKHKAAARP